MLILTLSQRVTQVVDDGAQVGPRREPLLEPLEQRPTIPALVHQPVPVRRAGDDRGRLSRVALLEPAALLPEPCARLATEPLRLGLLERSLHLQHLFQELPRRLRLVGRALADLPAFLQRDQVFHAGERLAQRAVGAVDQGRLAEDLRLALGVGALVEVGMVLPRQLVETPLQGFPVHPELAGQPEHREIVGHAPFLKTTTGPAGPAFVSSEPGLRPRTMSRTHSSISRWG